LIHVKLLPHTTFGFQKNTLKTSATKAMFFIHFALPSYSTWHCG